MINILVFILTWLAAGLSFSQELMQIEIELPSEAKNFQVPVTITSGEIENLSQNNLSLLEIRDGKKFPAEYQFSNSGYLCLLIKPGENKKKFTYEFSEGSLPESDLLNIDTIDGALVIHRNNMNFLSYFFKTVYPPEGVDTAYRRNGFIHPLWSPHGQVLTRIQPPDHYHHYGIWNPWTHVLFEGDTVDFWNIGDKKGTVRFAKLMDTEKGPVYSSFTVLHEHIAYKDGRGKTAINEIQSVKIYKPEEGADYYLLDINIEMECASGSPVKLLEYRYGGLGWRTTEKWDKYNSEVLTSENKTRKDADGSKAKWCIVQGEIDNDFAGIILMSHPDNFNHPEPLRIWPENQYDRGDMFANFSPTKDKDWLLEPGKKYYLKYRFIVFNNKMSAEKAETAWHSFAGKPEINIR